MVLLSLKSFFSSNKVLSAAFSILMIVCLVGGLFGINYTYCNVDFYNDYQSTQKNYSVLSFGAETSEQTKNFIGKYGYEVAFCYAELTADLTTNSLENQISFLLLFI